MIEYRQGNLLASNAEAIVNTVNCVGVMGKGIALQFKQAFPHNFQIYEQACRSKQVQPGKMLVVPADIVANPKYIINFPTKRHWKGKSRLEDIKSGLPALVEAVKDLGVTSVAVPPLGCGNGGLDWSEVAPLIEAAFVELPNVQVFIYTPEGAPANDAMPIATSKPRLTRSRALLIRLLETYKLPGYRLSMLEIQKLAYFLQVDGEKLKLHYTKHKYGPYAETLHHVLQRIEGHYIRGYGDRSSEAEVYLLPGSVEEARNVLRTSATAEEHMKRISSLIEGFETPYGMELLASVHWVIKEDLSIADDITEIIARVHSWNERKRNVFKSHHIRKAWHRLQDQAWIPVDEPSNVMA